MLLNFVSNRGRNLKGLYIKYLKRRRKKLLQELCLEPHTLTWLTLAPKTSRGLKGLIYIEDKSQIKWMSLYCQKSWMPWKMFYLQSMKKQGRKRSYGISVRISVTWLQRMRRGRRERCKKRRGSPRGIRSLSSNGGFTSFSFAEKMVNLEIINSSNCHFPLRKDWLLAALYDISITCYCLCK